MFKTSRIKSTIFLSVSILIFVVVFGTSILAEKIDEPSGIQQKLNGISEKEKKVLEELFNLTQEIGVAEGEEKVISREIEGTKEEIKAIEVEIKAEEVSYAEKQEGLKQVMKTYQRMGPGSYLEIIMNSDSLTTFLRRVNALRDLTRNTGKLLEKLDESKEKLSLEKKKQNEKLISIQEKQKQIKDLLTKKLQLKKEQEDYLASLKEESQFYRERLTGIERMIEELKPFLAKASEKFYSIAETGNVPEDALKVSLSLPYIKESLEDKVLNEIISKQPDFPKMVFTFNTDKTEIGFPEKNLVISGDFIVEDGYLLKFKAKEGSFYGMPLEAGYIGELFSGGQIALDCRSLLGGSTLESVETKNGYIQLTVKFSLSDLFN